MIKVNKNRVDLSVHNEDISAEFICLCVCLLDHYSRMYPRHGEALIKEMLDVSIKIFRKGGYK